MPRQSFDDNTALSLQQKLQETAFEAMLLRADLSESQKHNQQLMAHWAEICNSRGFRFLQLLYTIRLFLMPRGSYRERLGSASFDLLSWTGRGIRRAWLASVGRLRASRPSSEPVAAVPDHADAAMLPFRRLAPEAIARPRKGSPIAKSPAHDLSPRKYEEKSRVLQVDTDAVPYSPMSWQIVESPHSEIDFINLAVFSLLHRSGSTLLQRICNARKKTLIWGEHNGILNYFTEVYKSVAKVSILESGQRDAYFGQGENPNAWIASMCPDLEYIQQAIFDSTRALLNTLYGQYQECYDIVGFKEVRYGRAAAELLRTCYPKVKILLNVRHPYNTWNSSPRDVYPSVVEWAMLWDTMAREFMMLAHADPNCCLVRHEDIVRKDVGTMNVLAEVAHVAPDEVYGVLGHKIGSNHVGISDSDRQVILDHCRGAMELLDFATEVETGTELVLDGPASQY